MDFIVLLLIIWGVSGIIKSKKAQESGSDTSDSRESRREERRTKRQINAQQAKRQWEDERRFARQQEQLARQEEKRREELRRKEEQRQRDEQLRQEERRRQEEQRKREEQRREEIRRRDEERREKQQQEERRRKTAGTYTKEDILTRSSRDVNEDFGEDTLKKEAGLHQGCVEGHYEQHSELLKTVEDLMVLGPNCTISYERDFVGEGERMVETFK